MPTKSSKIVIQDSRSVVYDASDMVLLIHVWQSIQRLLYMYTFSHLTVSQRNENGKTQRKKYA